ncbi:MAG: phosphoglycerate mutase, partial [Nitrospinota bacterium]|nr:phosphoglycerate mutase [Nitrospinota bacterium]
MKYLVVIVAGLTDRPIAEKDNKTPLQLAETPNLDALVQKGRCGSVQTIPDSL